MAPRRKSDEIERAQLALKRNVAPLLGASVLRPHAGWLHATRDALGMSRAQMATRMGVTSRRISQLEQAEKNETIKLDTLRRAAEALNCDLVCALVPRGSYASVVEVQARSKASALAEQVAHTMRLENQEPTAESLSRTQRRHVTELLESGQLWDL